MGYSTAVLKRLPRALALAAVIAVPSMAAPAHAKQAVIDAFNAEFPGLLGPQACTSCHKNSGGPASGADSEWNRAFFQQIYTGPSLATYAQEIDAAADDYAPTFSASTGNVTISKRLGDNRDVPVAIDLGKKGLFSIPAATDTGPVVTTTGSVPSGVTFSGSGANWTIKLPTSLANRFGTVDVSLRAVSSDGLYCKSSCSPTKTFTITLGNNAPEVNAGPFNIVTGDSPVTRNNIASDPDGDDLVLTTTSITTAKGKVTLFLDGAKKNVSFTYDPDDGFAVPFLDSFDVTVGDGNKSTTKTVTVSTVPAFNRAPVAVDDTFAATEDTPFTGTAQATDLDADPLTFSALACTKNGTLNFTNTATGAFTYTPFADFNGTDVCSFSVSDGTVSDSATLTFNVASQPDAPTVTNLPDVAYCVGATTPTPGCNTAKIVTKSFDLKNAVTASETVRTGLIYTVVSVTNSDPALPGALIPDPSVLGTFSPAITVGTPLPLSAEGILRYSNIKNVPLNFTIRFKVSDPGILPTTAICGANDCGTLHVSYTVNENDRHDAADRDALAKSLGDRYHDVPLGVGAHFPKTEAEGACANCHVPGKETAVAPNCKSADFFNAFGQRLCAIRPFQRDADGSFTSRLNDALSQKPMFEPSIVSAPASIPVKESQTGDLGALIKFTNGLDLVTGAESKVVTAFIVEPEARDLLEVKVDGAEAKLSLRSGKSFGSYTKSDVLEVTVLPVNNGGRRFGSNAAGYGFYPTGANTPSPIRISIARELPVAVDDTADVSAAAASVSIPVLDNDTPAGGVDSARIISPPAKGSAKVVGRNIVFTPPKVAVQEDVTFTYKAVRVLSGSKLLSEKAATVTVTVYPEDVTVAQDDGPFLATIGQALTVDVLANDQGGKADSLVILTKQPMAHGKATVDNGQIRYMPKSAGTDILEYSPVSGGVTSPTTARVVFNVTNVNGDSLAAKTNDPQLKPVAYALGDSCFRIAGSAAPHSADQDDLVAVCNALLASNGIDGSLDSIRNEEVLGAGDAAMQHDRNTQGNILGRLDASRGGGGRGLTFGQFGLQVDGQTLSGDMLDRAVRGMGVDGTVLGSADNPWGLFVAGTLSVASQDSSSREAGFDTNGVDFTAGIDYAFNENTLLGLAVSFGRSGLDYANGGDLDTDSIQLALYGAMQITEGLSVDGYGGYAWTDYDLSRIVSVPGMADRVARGSFDGDQLSTSLRLKYAQTLGSVDVETYGTLSYLAVTNSAYTETGAGGLSLDVGKQDFDTLTGTLGMKFSKPFDTEWALITPYISGAYSYQFIADDRSVYSQFQAAAGLGAAGFTVRSDGEGRNFGSIELGLSAENDSQIKTTASVAGTVSDGGFESLSVRAAVNIPFGASKPEPEPVVQTQVKKPVPTQVPPPAVKKTPTVPGGASGDSGSSGGSGSAGGGGWN